MYLKIYYGDDITGDSSIKCWKVWKEDVFSKKNYWVSRKLYPLKFGWIRVQYQDEIGHMCMQKYVIIRNGFKNCIKKDTFQESNFFPFFCIYIITWVNSRVVMHLCFSPRIWPNTMQPPSPPSTLFGPRITRLCFTMVVHEFYSACIGILHIFYAIFSCHPPFCFLSEKLCRLKP